MMTNFTNSLGNEILFCDATVMNRERGHRDWWVSDWPQMEEEEDNIGLNMCGRETHHVVGNAIFLNKSITFIFVIFILFLLITDLNFWTF